METAEQSSEREADTPALDWEGSQEVPSPSPAYERAQTQSEVGPEQYYEFKDLKQFFINERLAPELLPYRGYIINRVKERLKRQEEILSGLEAHGEENELLCMIQQHDIQRIKYLLKAYHRCRLGKIEKYFLHIADQPDEHAKLCPQESRYLQGYFMMFGHHMRESFLKKLPKDFQSVIQQSTWSSPNDIAAVPNLDHFVMCRVLQDCGKVDVNDGKEHRIFKEGDQYVVRYSMIKDLLEENRVALI